MPKIYFGCDDIPRHWNRYFPQCNAIELDLEQLDNPPKIKTLNRWRVDSPKGFAFLLRADRSVEVGLAAAGGGEFSETFSTGWSETLERAQALAAKAIVLRTPIGFSPGNDQRAAVEAFANKFAAEANRPVIWEAQGMWDTEATREWASKLGLIYAYDPFLAMRDELPFGHGDAAFVIQERAGMRREFDRYDIRGLLDRLGSYNRVFVMLRGRFKWEHARHFADLLGYPPQE